MSFKFDVPIRPPSLLIYEKTDRGSRPASASAPCRPRSPCVFLSFVVVLMGLPTLPACVNEPHERRLGGFSNADFSRTCPKDLTPTDRKYQN